MLTLILAFAHVRFFFKGHLIPNDFTAFYCGGEVALEQHDFYLLEPLTACEKRISENGSLIRSPPFPPYGIPVPLPPYDFSVLSLLALLQLTPAKIVFGLLEISAMLLTTAALRRLTGLPIAAALGVSFYGTAYQAQLLGQLAPFTIAALALATLAFREGRILLGSIALGVSLVQPQIAAPALLGALLVYPEARRTILICVGIVVATGFLFGGPYRTIEYLQLLPLHARAEIAFPPQYSLSFALHQVGLGSTQALLVGALSYGLTLVLSLLVVFLRKEAARKSGVAILLPAAFSVLGGSFIHAYQIAVALLIAVVPIYSKRTAPFVSVGLTLLICPWPTLASVPFTKTILLSVVSSLTAVAITIYFLQVRILGKRQAALLSAACVALSLALFLTLHAKRPITLVNHEASIQAPAVSSDTLGSLAWGDGINLTNRGSAPRGSAAYQWTNWYVKFPLWFALLLILPCASYELLRLRSGDGQETRSAVDLRRSMLHQ